MPAPFVEVTFPFPLYNFSFFVKNQVFIGMWINIQVFNSISLVNLPVFMPTLGCFSNCSSIIELDVRDVDAYRSYFLVQDCFGYPGFCFCFCFLHEVEYCSFKVYEDYVGILMGIASNLQIVFGKIAIFIMLILPI